MMFTQDLIYLILISGLVTLFIVPVARLVSVSLGAVDSPDHRKTHKGTVPMAGGIAMFIGFLVAVYSFDSSNSAVLGLLLGGLLIFIIGVIDDIYDIHYVPKLIGQIAAASIAVYFGIQIDIISNFLGSSAFDAGYLAVPLTILWIVGVTNVINFLDGLDGLAAGVVAIASGIIGIASLMLGQVESAFLAFALSMVAFAFLPFNFSKNHKTFMGDSGSNFLGFALAVIAIFGAVKTVAVFTLLVPLLVLAIPVIDTAIVIFSRILKGRHITEADRGHLHHRLLDLGLSEKYAVILIYSLTLILGGIAFVTLGLSSIHSLLLFGIAFVVLSIFMMLLVVRHHRINNGKKTSKKSP